MMLLLNGKVYFSHSCTAVGSLQIQVGSVPPELPVFKALPTQKGNKLLCVPCCIASHTSRTPDPWVWLGKMVCLVSMRHKLWNPQKAG